MNADEPVDGAGLPLAEHTEAIATALKLTEKQTEILVSELRNALTPAEYWASKGDPPSGRRYPARHRAGERARQEKEGDVEMGPTRMDVVREVAYKMAARGLTFPDATAELRGEALSLVNDWHEQGGRTWERFHAAAEREAAKLRQEYRWLEEQGILRSDREH